MSRVGKSFLGVVLSASVLAACGGSSSSSGLFDGDAGDGGSGDGNGGTHSGAGGGASTGGKNGGGASNSGGAGNGTGGSAPGSGGTSTGAGGAVATGGAPGTGGTGTEGPCRPPANSAQTAVCVTFQPETLATLADPALDGRGGLVVQLYDTPTPAQGAAPIAERVITADVTIDALPTIRLVGTMPATVYVRAVFIDNPALLKAGSDLTFGSWIGGIDLSDGFQKDEPIKPVPVQIGRANEMDLALTALRRLRVTAHLATTPMDDGQGPLSAVAVRSADVSKKPPAVGFGVVPCADLTAGNVTVTGFIVGSGTFYVTALLDDYGLKGDFPPGAIVGLDVKPNLITIPKQLVVAPDAYSASVTVDLNYVNPVPDDGGGPAPRSCADYAGDGGSP